MSEEDFLKQKIEQTSIVYKTAAKQITDNDFHIYIGEETKTILNIQHLKIHLPKKFNWFNKKMLKLVFGLEIKDE